MKNNKNYQCMTQKGFTLIEIMITVAILGIISAIALPSYTEHVKKGKRSDAKVELLRLAQMQESYFVQNLSYAKDLTQLGFGANTIDSDKQLYDLVMGGVTPVGCNPAAVPPAVPVACTTYNITATPDTAEAQTGDLDCQSFRIDEVGRQQAFGGSLSAHGVTAAHIANARLCW